MFCKNTFLNLLITITIGLFSFKLIGCSSAQETTKKKTTKEQFEEGKAQLDKENYEEAKKIFETITLQDYNGEYADKAQFYLAESYFLNDEFKLATFHFNRLRALYPASKYYSYSLFRSGESYEKSAPQYERDQQTLKYSIDQFKAFLSLYPTDNLADSAAKKIKFLRGILAEKELSIANHYVKVTECRSAIIYFDKVIDNFSDTDNYDVAVMNKIKCLKDLDEINEAKKIGNKFLEDKPNTKFAEEIRNLIK